MYLVPGIISKEQSDTSDKISQNDGQENKCIPNNKPVIERIIANLSNKEKVRKLFLLFVISPMSTEIHLIILVG